MGREMFHKIAYFSGDLSLHLRHASLSPPSQNPKIYLDSFSRFNADHGYVQQRESYRHTATTNRPCYVYAVGACDVA